MHCYVTKSYKVAQILNYVTVTFVVLAIVSCNFIFSQLLVTKLIVQGRPCWAKLEVDQATGSTDL